MIDFFWTLFKITSHNIYESVVGLGWRFWCVSYFFGVILALVFNYAIHIKNENIDNYFRRKK